MKNGGKELFTKMHCVFVVVFVVVVIVVIVIVVVVTLFVID